MKVYSWNVLFQNKEFENAIEFIKNLDFDVLTLQEVPEHFLTQLKELPLNIAYSTDTDRIDSAGAAHTDSLVILSHFPVERSEPIAFPPEWYPEPKVLRSKVAAKLLSWRHPYRNKTGLRAELVLPDMTHVQIFCVHQAIVFATPQMRLNEFEHLMEERDKELPTVFCGDFNILELPHITFLNWLSGGSLGSWLLWWKERKEFKEQFKKYSLQNPLRGKITHFIALSQLDHVLVPMTSKVKSWKVLPRTAGSDHRPVMVEFEV